MFREENNDDDEEKIVEESYMYEEGEVNVINVNDAFETSVSFPYIKLYQ